MRKTWIGASRAGLHGSRRPVEDGRGNARTGRAAGWTSTLVVGTLIAASVLVGVGAAGTESRMSDAGAWLASLKNSTIVHVNGSTGRVDGVVRVGADTKGPLDVVQEGQGLLVLDRSTGVVTRIDPGQLTVAQAKSFDSARMRIVASEDSTWAVDEAAATVQRIDRVTLGPDGKMVQLPGKPEAARIDEEDVLWVLVPSKGTAIPVADDELGEPAVVGEPGERARLTVAAGRAAVLNTKAGTLSVLSSEAQGLTIRLPGELAASAPDSVLMAEQHVSPLVPILAPDTGSLVVANVESGVVQATKLDETAGRSYGAPQALGSRIYIPDTGTGELVVYDTASARFESRIQVTGKPGDLEVHARGDRLWVNDQDNATAAVVDDEGKVHRIDKYDTQVPGADTSSASPSASNTPSPNPSTPRPPVGTPVDPVIDPVADPVGDAPGSDAGDGTGSGPGDDSADGGSFDPPASDPDPVANPPAGAPAPVVTVTKTVTPPPAPAPPQIPKDPPPAPTSPPPAPTTPAPTKTPGPTGNTGTGTGSPTPTETNSPPPQQTPPGRPKAQTSGDGITLTYAPGSGARPDRYELEGAPAGSEVTPKTGSPKGPFRFDIGKLTCAKDVEYSFKVVAVYGDKRLASPASSAVRPCVAPGAPKITGQTRSNHQVKMSWKAPPGVGLMYEVTWKGDGDAPDGKATTTSTSYTIKNLKNSSIYNVTVKAVNAAGTSSASSVKVDMTPPKLTLQVHHNEDDGVNMGIRNEPDSQNGGRAGAIPSGYNKAIVVHCQTKGTTESRWDGTGGKSAIWDKVTYQGITGYTTDVYISTSNSGRNAYSPELWECE
ncbi:fibronectin type III domain-containing protein [Yinghuangia sp. YIM S09857]|uniref:fibronectin type III domain-containing protein n=1 Tax=Yinghuangia sp. YIM S09857 TaxID=3436929 RepID=UPI003F53DE94